MKLIDKDALVAKIEKLRAKWFGINNDFADGQKGALTDVLSLINTIEVKEVDAWHLQEKEDIYDAVKDWSLQTFVCVMKDGSIQKFIGNLDEDHEGHINVHIDGVNDAYDDVNDIVKWIELT